MGMQAKQTTLLTRAKSIQLFWPLVALIFFLCVNAVIVPGFLEIEILDGHLYGSLIDIVKRATPGMFLAIGLTLCIGTRGNDISVGSVMAICGGLAATLVHNDVSLWIAIPCSLLVGMLCGAWNGFLVSQLGVQPMVATLIMMTSGRGIAQLILKGNILTIKDKPTFGYIGGGYLFGLPFSIYLLAIFAFLIITFVNKTSFKMFVESIGYNRQSSRYTGIKVSAVIWCCYIISGLCAAIAGIILTSEVSAADGNNAGLNMELDAIMSVVLGGTSMAGGRFSIGASLIGALIVQSMTTMSLATGIPMQVTLLVKAVVVVIVVIIQTPGLLTSFIKFLFPNRKKKGGQAT